MVSTQPSLCLRALHSADQSHHFCQLLVFQFHGGLLFLSWFQWLFVRFGRPKKRGLLLCSLCLSLFFFVLIISRFGNVKNKCLTRSGRYGNFSLLPLLLSLLSPFFSSLPDLLPPQRYFPNQSWTDILDLFPRFNNVSRHANAALDFCRRLYLIIFTVCYAISDGFVLIFLWCQLSMAVLCNLSRKDPIKARAQWVDI